MKKTMVVSILSVCLSFAAGAALAEKVHDWHDLDEVHGHVVEAIHEMERARAANHYDMAGHGVKAEEHLRAAERELHEAVEASRMAR
jgi:Na+/phosphate symporter